MLFDAVVLGVILALLTGGRFSRLAQLDLRRPWWFVAAFGLQFAIRILGLRGWPLRGAGLPGQGLHPAVIGRFETCPTILAASAVLYLLSYLLLLAALVANWRLRPLWIAALGVVMNFIVIAANRGAMPANPEYVRASGQLLLLKLVEAGRWPTHTLLDAHSRLPFLADNYLLPALPTHFPRSCAFSPGDVLITVGVVALIVRGMWGSRGTVPAFRRKTGTVPCRRGQSTKGQSPQKP